MTIRSCLICLSLITLSFTMSAAPRNQQRLDSDWSFKQSDVSGAERPDFDDHDWQRLSLPHNWGWEAAQKGENFYRGPGWYRRTLVVPPKSGRRCFLRFEAASSVADVFLNGHKLGQHRGAFGAFCFEITTNLAASGTNLLAVRVSNAPEHDLAPLSGDFCVYGGLYRPVHLIETDAVNFCLTDHASPGVAWLQTTVSQDRAEIHLQVQISNGTKTKREGVLHARIIDASGQSVADVLQPITLVPSDTEPYWVKLQVSNPHLWNGRTDPYLYRAVAQVLSKDGTLEDEVEQPLGLRTYAIDPEHGFILNGRPYSLHGVNRHQERWNKGWAITEADMDEDLSLILELGCTVVRCAHYQHCDYFYSLCDRAGLLVWAELPQVNEVDPSPQFAETSRRQLLDLIRQNINHPSIFAWSLFNELWPGRPDPHRELMDLKVVANGEDPTRPTIAATATRDLPQMNRIPDLLGWNIYPGWYNGWGPKENFGRLMDEGRTMSRHGGLCISEYGAGANPNQHEENPSQPKTDGQWHPEEYQSLVHEAAWAAASTRPFVWGTFVWNMFDFTVNTRREGGVVGRNDKGLVTSDRKLRKDAFYFYKANWTATPMVYITSRRYVDRTNAVTSVKIYSNTPEVELLVNGRSQGKLADASNRVFRWENIHLQPGENRIEARGNRDHVIVTDECTWILK